MRTVADRGGMQALFRREKFDAVMNLAAQAGVRYSIENPNAYIDAILSLPTFVEWRAAALKEPWVMRHNEPDWPLVRGV